MPLSIRPAKSADSEALSRICLLTANYGTSSEELHNIKELPGLVYALPYVNLPSTFGHVLISSDDEGVETEVVGYILGTHDTSAFMKSAEADWYPPLRTKYPIEGENRTPMDKHYIKLIHRPDQHPTEVFGFSPAHIHIDILPQAQRQGWGRKLIGKAMETLSKQEPSIKGLWVGVDPRNEEGKKFYKKLGGQRLPTSHGEVYTLKFSDFWESASPAAVH